MWVLPVRVGRGGDACFYSGNVSGEKREEKNVLRHGGTCQDIRADFELMNRGLKKQGKSVTCEIIF